MLTTTIEIQVQPRASRNRVVTQDGKVKVKVYVTAAPDRGRANKAVVEAFARNLELPKQSVSIVSGERSRTKLLTVVGLSEAEVLCRLG